MTLRGGRRPQDLAAAHGLSPQFVYSHALNGFAARMPAARAEALKRDPDVLRVEPDGVAHALPSPLAGLPANTSANSGADALEKPAASATPAPPQAIPTGIRRSGAAASATARIDGVDGDVAWGLEVAVIDTGIDLSHADLNVDRALGRTFYGRTRNGQDDNGHGSHVAGTIAARDNAIGVVGAAPGLALVPVKVLNGQGSGTWSAIIAGIDYVTALSGRVKVANMSLGGPRNQSVNDAVRRSIAAGITYAVAAGNSGAEAAYSSPASVVEALTVTALADSDGLPGRLGAATSYGPDDTMASFSNYSLLGAVDLAAPGVAILSTYKGGSYATLSGTSMATPHVAGAAALYLQANPGASPAAVAAALTTIHKVDWNAPDGYPSDASGRHTEPLIQMGTM